MAAGTTLSRHLIEEGGWRKDGAEDLRSLLEPIALAGKILAREVDQAALAASWAWPATRTPPATCRRSSTSSATRS